jgi:PPOX class probable F420-dependent enzyme
VFGITHGESPYSVGMSDGVLPGIDSAFGRRVRDRLRDERVIWLTTCGADGTPQPNPVWFLWEDPARVLIFSRADAYRLVHIRSRPRVSLHFNSDADGGDVVVLTGSAGVASDVPPAHRHAAYTAKYGDAMTRVSGRHEDFSAEYPVPLVVTVDRVRGF